MWARNLLFLGLLVGGVGALTAYLFPPPGPAQPPPPAVSAEEAADFQASLERVNAALARQWTESEVTPAPKASPLQVARRLALALMGTIPSLQEVRHFEHQEPEPALQEWLDRILADRRFSDYFAERLARAYVGSEDGPFIVYRRRRFVSWLSDELLRNRPYDEVVRELIASQGLWTDKPATNFITVTIEQDNQKGPNPERLAGRVTRAFLGIRLDCAQCHNHPFQGWKQADFRGLTAFFGQVHQGFTGTYDGAGEFTVQNPKTKTVETIAPAVPFSQELLPADGTRRERLARWVTDRRNPYFALAAVNRVWALLFGKPLLEPVDDLASAGEMPPVLRLLAEDFVAHNHDLQRLIRLIAATDAFRLDSAAEFEITDAHERAWAVFPLTRLRPEQVVGSVLQAASLETLNHETHILFRIAKAIGQNDFVKRYGDTGEDEFEGRGGTIPQRLLMMNGEIVKGRTKEDLFTAAARIRWLAPNERAAVDAAYLAILTRRPTAEEAEHFVARLTVEPGQSKEGRMEDLYWVLINSTEFSWNH